MNKDVPDDDAAIRYYDSDYPSLEIGEPQAGQVVQLERMGILGDVGFYKELAARTGGPVLEVGCGTGRLTIPLARLGLEVWAVDVSAGMLAQLRAKLAREEASVQARVRIAQQDAATLDLPERGFALALLPFNTLMLIPDPDEEQATLAALAAHMAPGAVLAFDVMNPPTLPLQADRTPAPCEPRVAPDTGNRYVRTAMNTALDVFQRQRVCGWYDELLPDGTVRSSDFAFHWRMIFHAELEPMLRKAGFALESLAGDFEGTDWTVQSRRMVVTARVERGRVAPPPHPPVARKSGDRVPPTNAFGARCLRHRLHAPAGQGRGSDSCLGRETAEFPPPPSGGGLGWGHRSTAFPLADHAPG